MKKENLEEQLKSIELPIVMVKTHKEKLRRAVLNTYKEHKTKKNIFDFHFIKNSFVFGMPLLSIILGIIYVTTIIFAPTTMNAQKVMAQVIEVNDNNQKQGEYRYMKYEITTFFDKSSKNFLYEIVDGHNFRLTKELDPLTGKVIKQVVFDTRANAQQIANEVKNCDLNINKIMNLEDGTQGCFPIYYEQCDIAKDAVTCKVEKAKKENKSFYNVFQRSNAICYMVNDRYFIIYGNTADEDFIQKHTYESTKIDGNSSEEETVKTLSSNGYTEIDKSVYIELFQMPEIIDAEVQYQREIKELKENPAELGIDDGSVVRVEFRGYYYLQISPLISLSFDPQKLIDENKSTEYIDIYIQKNGFRKVSIDEYVRGNNSNIFYGIDPAQPIVDNNSIDPTNLFLQLKDNKDVKYIGEREIDGKNVYVLGVDLTTDNGNRYIEASFNALSYELYKVDEYKMSEGKKNLELSYKIISLDYSNTEPAF
ncbi:MAG: hypothetical protein WCJ58_04570 [bacterium]